MFEDKVPSKATFLDESFADEDPQFDTYKTKSLKELVASANKDNNSHFARVPRHFSVRKILERIRKKKNRHSQKFTRKEHSEDLEEEAVSSSRPLFIFPNYLQVPEKHKNRLIFGCLEMHEPIKDIIMLSSDNEDINEGPSKGKVPKEDINEGPSKEKLAPLGSSTRHRSEVGPGLAKLFKYGPPPDLLRCAELPIGVVFGLANLKTWDDIVQKMRRRKPGNCAAE
nr:26S proteasome non-ATPase regulatory subunit 4 [Tanacetum cinerariifolium]